MTPQWFSMIGNLSLSQGNPFAQVLFRYILFDTDFLAVKPCSIAYDQGSSKVI